MKRASTTFFQVLFICLFTAQFAAFAQTYNLVWSDEFNGSMSSAWKHEVGGNWPNNEKQYYKASNTTFSSTDMIITAKKENFEGRSYTSSRMTTQGTKSFTYGRMEARMRLPMVNGTWPAFWMIGTNYSTVGWPACGEIDIMEHVNADTKVLGTIHWQGPNGYAHSGGSGTTSPGNYHVYRVDWTPADIRWFIDGVQYYSVNIQSSINSTEEFHRPFFFILNLAVGGDLTGGVAIDDSKLPASMFVDYVRAYQPVSRIEAENYISMYGIQTEGCSEGTLNVGWIDAGDWMAYNVNIPRAGSYRFSYRVSSPNSSRTLRLEKDNGATLLGTVNIPNTGGWQNWTTVSHTVSLPAGSYSIGIATATGGFNLNWIEHFNSTGARLAIEEVKKEETALSYYPNPVKSRLSYKLPEGVTSHNLQIRDFQGKQITSLSVGDVGTENSIDLSGLERGFYIMRISNNEFSKTFKIEKD